MEGKTGIQVNAFVDPDVFDEDGEYVCISTDIFDCAPMLDTIPLDRLPDDADAFVDCGSEPVEAAVELGLCYTEPEWDPVLRPDREDYAAYLAARKEIGE